MNVSSTQNDYRLFSNEENIEWPVTTAYLLLDAVRFDNIKRWIYEAEPIPEMRILYLNTELYDIAVVSSELVKVEKQFLKVKVEWLLSVIPDLEHKPLNSTENSRIIGTLNALKTSSVLLRADRQPLKVLRIEHIDTTGGYHD